MSKIIIKIILLLNFILLGCSKAYYIGESVDSLKVFSTNDTTTNALYIIPKGSIVLTKKNSRKYHHIIFENYQGYVYNPKYTNYRRYNSSTDGILYGYSSVKPKKVNKYYNKNNSKSNGSSTVKVKGYYRKDGTYVKPHTRSKSTKRKY